jgi:hypothetical protein
MGKWIEGGSAGAMLAWANRTAWPRTTCMSRLPHNPSSSCNAVPSCRIKDGAMQVPIMARRS